MNKVLGKNIVIKYATKLGNNDLLTSIRDGLETIYPLMMSISIASLLAYFPSSRYQLFMNAVLGERWRIPVSIINELVLSLISIYVVFVVTYRYAKTKKIASLKTAILGITAYILLLPINNEVEMKKLFSYTHVFYAILISVMTIHLYKLTLSLINKINLKLEKNVPMKIIESFTQFLPFILVLLVMLSIKLLVSMTQYLYLYNLVQELIQKPLLMLGRTIVFPVVYQLFSTILWFLGINGPSVTNTVYSPITTVLSQENIYYFNQGIEVKNIQSWAFSDFLANYGGGGSTLSLVLVMMLFSKSEKMKHLAKISLLPGIFGINEMVIFGFPIINNLSMLLPFVLVPVLNMSLAYIATAYGLIPKMFGLYLPWATPVFLSGWLLTGSMKTVLFQLFQVILGAVIYYPFFIKEDKKQLINEKSK